MKALMFAAATAALAVASPALAQDAPSFLEPITPYATIGYAGASQDDVHLGAIQGRLGAQFGKYLAVEGELAGGVKKDSVTESGVTAEVKLDSQYAIYAVGVLPVAPNFDLFARLGYGHTKVSASALGFTAAGS